VVEDILASDRRRDLLAALAEAGDPVALTDVAAAVEARRRGIDAEAVDPSRRRDLRDDLLEIDVPKLTATGVVTYDSMLSTVDLRRPALAREAIEATRTGDDG
jgi:hypothetical protein